MKITQQLERLPKIYIMVMALVFIAFTGLVDYRITIELSLSIFHLIPILFVTWFIDGKTGLWFSCLSAVVWLIGYLNTQYLLSHQYTWLPYWNSLVRLGFFSIIAYLLSQLKNAYEYEKKLARMDMLTGAINYRFFLIILDIERERFQRYQRPFSLAYFDVDYFKQVNDQLGHQAGNHLLCLITETVNQNLRATDTLARLGGDEFAILFPETDFENVQIVIQRIAQDLQQVVNSASFPVSFSFGVMTFLSLPPSVDDIIDQADQLMYEVKQSGKNGIKYQVFQDEIHQ